MPAEHGLFAYPVLQAADILLYDADLVPVGQDQKQHLEITRDIAERFNRVYGGGKDVFRLPKAHILESVAVIPGLDGRKMSKSYNNTIDIFDDPATIRKKVKKIVTDSTPVEAPKNPDTCPLFNLFKLFASPDELGRGRAPLPRGGDRLRRSENPAGRGHDCPVCARAGAAGRLVGSSRARRGGPRRRRRSRETTARVVLDRARAACGGSEFPSVTRTWRSPMSIDVSEEFSHANHHRHSHQSTDPGGAMNDLFGPESRRDLLQRGFSRRDFGRLAALLTAGAILAVLQRVCSGTGALGDAQPAARRGQDQRQRKPHGPLPRGGRGNPQDRQPGGAIPLQRNLRVQRASWLTSKESPKTT